MQLERLRLVNFRQHEDTELVLGAGLTGIVGPNGAGKTTLLEAVAWALYGSDAARGTRETLRRRGAPSRAPVRVELDFCLGAHRYRVVRGLNTAELYQDGGPEPVANSLNTVTERIVRLLGMSREEFFNTYFTGQKQLAVMTAMPPVERARFLSRVLGYDRLQTIQERLRERRNQIRVRLQALEASLPDPAELDQADQRARLRLEAAAVAEGEAVAALRRLESRLAEVAPRWAETQQLRERMVRLEADLRLAEHRVTSARERFQELDRQLVAANEARARFEPLRERIAPLEELRAEGEQLDARAAAHARRQAATAQLEEARTALTAVEARVQRLPPVEAVELARQEAETMRAKIAAVSEQVEERRTAWVRDLQDAQTKRETLLDQYKELREQQERVTRAGPNGACPTCARPLGAEYDTVLGVLDRQLQDVLFNGNYYKQRIEQLAGEPQEVVDLEAGRAALARAIELATARVGSLTTQAQEGPTLRTELARQEARIRELEAVQRESADRYDAERHAEVRRLVAELGPLALQAERFRTQAERAEVLVMEAEVAEGALSELEGQARAVHGQMATLGYSEGTFLAAREAFEATERERGEAQLAIVRAQGESRSAEEGLKAVAARREERATREADARRNARDLAVHNELDRAFTDLRTELNLQLRPDLSELASGFLRDLTRGRYTEVELDEDYGATLLEGGEPKPVLSGGEEDLVNLALRLGISQMIADRAGQPLSLLVLDEIFGSLDEERRTAVVDLLRSLADRFPQVILITHIETIREGFDRVVRVDFDEERNVALVKDETPGTPDGLAA